MSAARRWPGPDAQAPEPPRRRGRVPGGLRVRLAPWGTLPVTVCPLCAALVVAHGAVQHERWHLSAGNGGGLS